MKLKFLKYDSKNHAFLHAFKIIIIILIESYFHPCKKKIKSIKILSNKLNSEKIESLDQRCILRSLRTLFREYFGVRANTRARRFKPMVSIILAFACAGASDARTRSIFVSKSVARWNYNNCLTSGTTWGERRGVGAR